MTATAPTATPMTADTYRPELDGLVHLGLSGYAARVLAASAALARPANTAELALAAAVPRTSVYAIIGALEADGLISQEPRVRPARWSCDGWAGAITRLRARTAARTARDEHLVRLLAGHVGVWFEP